MMGPHLVWAIDFGRSEGNNGFFTQKYAHNGHTQNFAFYIKDSMGLELGVLELGLRLLFYVLACQYSVL